jgi:Flp pilus assembly protein TadG
MTAQRALKKRRSGGNAMVEVALSVGVLVPCLTGVFEFGYTFYVYNRLIAAVRDGARYASLLTYDSATTTPSSSYATAVKNTVVYGNQNGGTATTVPGLTTDRVSVSMTMLNSIPDMVTVTISSYSVNTIFATLQWSNKPAASFHFEGRWAP